MAYSPYHEYFFLPQNPRPYCSTPYKSLELAYKGVPKEVIDGFYYMYEDRVYVGVISRVVFLD